MVRMIADANAELDALIQSGVLRLQLITNNPTAAGTPNPVQLAVAAGYDQIVLNAANMGAAAAGVARNTAAFSWTSSGAWALPVTGVALWNDAEGRHTDFVMFPGSPRTISAANEAIIIDEQVFAIIAAA